MITIKRHVILVILLLFCCAATLRAQQEQKFNLPKVTLPSPAVQNFTRYGEIPVDYSTGVPNISIPLYTATSGQLSVPISISYHASGIKVQDRASVIGLGWVMNCGGFVTQTILGNGSGSIPADKTEAAFRAGRYALLGNYSGLDSWMINKYVYEFPGYKMQSDRFTYQLPGGEGGVFRYDYISGDLVKPSYSPSKILPGNIASTVPGKRFEITDSKGVIYNFTNDYVTNPQTVYISSMVSADKTDTIRFTYKATQNEYYQPSWSSALSLSFDPYVVPDPYPLFTGQLRWAPNQGINSSISPNYYTYELVPESIITKSTLIIFTTANGRLDMAGSGKLRITNMSVYRRSDNQLIKSVDFNQDYFGSSGNNNQRLRLSSLTSKGSDGVAVETHTFGYEATELPPYPENLSSTPLTRFREDYWGYYNGTQSYTMIPKQFVPAYIPPETRNSGGSTVAVNASSSTSRDPDSTYAKAAMLKEIIYPTGGKTVFDFEPNRAANAYQYPAGFTVPDIVGGFRIRAIKNYLEDGTLANYRYYRYGPGQTQAIREDLFSQMQRSVVTLPNWIYMATQAIISYPTYMITSSAYVPLTCDNGPPVFYASVAEFIGGMNVNAGKTLYTYETPPMISNPNAGFDAPVHQGPYFYDRGNYQPKLLSRKAYKRLSNGNYMPVSEALTSYASYLDAAYHMGMKTIQTTTYPNNDYPYDYPGRFPLNDALYDAPIGQDGGQGGPFYLTVVDVKANQELRLPTQTTERTYDPTDSTKYMDRTTNLTYGNLAAYTSLGMPAHTEPTQILTTASTGDLFLTTLSYPADYPSTQPYSTMVSRNILTPVIEKTEYKTSVSSGNFLQSTKTDYQFWANGMAVGNATDLIYPDKFWIKKGSPSNGFDLISWMMSYSNEGNLQEAYEKWGGPATSYLWGYNKQYPVAEARNAKLNEIYHNNFEEATDYPDWAVVKDNTVAHTGNYSGRITNPNSGELVIHSNTWLQVNLGGQAKKFRYSGWVYSNGPSVEMFLFAKRAGETGYYTYLDWTSTTETNKWVYLDKEFTVPGDVTQLNLRLDNNSAGTVWFDDLRIAPADAQMTTFTYKPLIGTSSATDNNGITTYYEYDNYQRLKDVKDKDGKVIKHIDYRYKQ